MPTTLINLNNTTPAAPSNGQNVLWQSDSSNPINVSAYLNLNSTDKQILFNNGGVLAGDSSFTWNTSTKQLSLTVGDLVGGILIDANNVVTGASRVIEITNIQEASVIRFVSAAGDVDIQISPATTPSITFNISNGVGELSITPTNLEFQNVGASAKGQSIFRLNNAGAAGGGGYIVDVFSGTNTSYGPHAALTNNGLSSIVASSKLTAQSAAITATTIFTPTDGSGLTKNQAGLYRVSYRASITTAATSSATLGGTNGFQIKYTDLNDSVVKTSNPTTPVVSSVNATTTTISGCLYANCKGGTDLQYLFDYASSGVTAMSYDLDIYVEYLG